MAEEPAAHLGERQDPLDPPVALGEQITAAVTQPLLDDPLPADAVEEGGLGTVGDEGLPAGLVRLLEGSDPGPVRLGALVG